MDTFSNTLTLQIDLYDKEKNEILNGSKAVGEKKLDTKSRRQVGKRKRVLKNGTKKP